MRRLQRPQRAPRDPGECNCSEYRQGRRTEIELQGSTPFPCAAWNEKFGVGREILDGVVRRELHAPDEPIAIVERRQDARRAELPLVDQVLRLS